MSVEFVCYYQCYWPVLLTILFVPPPFSSVPELLSSSASVLVTLEISPYPLDWAQVHVDLFWTDSDFNGPLLAAGLFLILCFITDIVYNSLCAFQGHSGGVNCLRFSPDGRWIASASDDSLVKVCMAKPNPEIIRRLLLETEENLTIQVYRELAVVFKSRMLYNFLIFSGRSRIQSNCKCRS